MSPKVAVMGQDQNRGTAAAFERNAGTWASRRTGGLSKFGRE